MLLVTSLSLFSISIYLITGLLGEKVEIATHLNLLFLVLTFTTFLYIQIQKNKKTTLSLWYICPLIIVLSIATPAFLQTDQYRYVWDGLNTVNGINPYRFAPIDNPMFNSFNWTGLINHPNLSTIYPPFAQISFAISSYLNPYFLFDEYLKITDPVQVLIGFKLLIGILTCAYIVLNRNTRWDLVVGHPLYLYTVFANTHLDSLLVLVFGIALLAIKKGSDYVLILSMSVAVLIKWFPLIFFPGVLIWIQKRYGGVTTVSYAALSLGIMGIFINSFYIGAGGNMFTSLGHYGTEWFFNGLIHHVLMDVFGFFMSFELSIQVAKAVCVIVAAVIYVKQHMDFLKNKLSIQELLLNTVLIYLIFVPTLMPWYFLVLLPFILLFERAPLLIWCWPIITMSSKAFFYNNADPVILRYIVTGVVFYFIYDYLTKKKLQVFSTHLF